MDLAINLAVEAQGTVNYGDIMFGPSGDLLLTADSLGGATNPILQDVHIRLRTFLGEWFMDSTLGIPWRELSQAAANATTQLDAVLQNEICTTPGILQLNSYNSTFDRSKRRASISFTAASTQGPINYAATLGAGSATDGSAS